MHEIKYDGYRCLLAVAGKDARIYTRSGLDWTDRFRPLAEEAATLGLSSALIDGEIIAPDAEGNPDFSTLQKALKGEANLPLTLFAFDLLEQDGKSLEDLVKTSKPGPVFNQAAQIWNHTFFWNSLKPQGGGEPKGALADAIVK